MLQSIKKGTTVSLAYFVQSLDPRWMRYFRGPSPEIKLFDLDRYTDELFGLGKAAPSMSPDFGRWLP